MSRPFRAEVAHRVTLVGDDHGDEHNAPILLLHGGGQTRHAWGSTAAALGAAGFRAVSIDLRGHGDSSWSPDGDYSMERFGADLTVLCSLLGRPVVVGASLGGIAGLIAAGTRPVEAECPMRALVLVDVAPRLEPAGVARIISFMTERPDGFASLEEAADAVAAYQPHRPRPRDLSGLAKNLRQGTDGRWRWHWDPAFMHADRRPRAASNPELLIDCARRVDVPALLVRGRMSDVVSNEGVDEFRAAVPHGLVVDVGGAGHMVAGDRNDAFTAEVVAFVSGLGA